LFPSPKISVSYTTNKYFEITSLKLSQTLVTKCDETVIFFSEVRYFTATCAFKFLQIKQFIISEINLNVLYENKSMKELIRILNFLRHLELAHRKTHCGVLDEISFCILNILQLHLHCSGPGNKPLSLRYIAKSFSVWCCSIFNIA